MLIITPGSMCSGSSPKSLSPAKGCGAEWSAPEKGPAGKQPASNYQMQAPHISKVPKMCLSRPSNFFINLAFKKEEERKKKMIALGP